MFLTKTQGTSTFRFRTVGLAVLFIAPVFCAASWLAVDGAKDKPSEPTRRAGVKVIPLEQSNLQIPKDTLQGEAASRIVLDENGNRISPSSGKDLPAEMQSSSSPKTGFGYRVETTSEGYRRLIPNTPIRSFSEARLDENHEIKIDCFTGPVSLLESRQTSTKQNKGEGGQ